MQPCNQPQERRGTLLRRATTPGHPTLFNYDQSADNNPAIATQSYNGGMYTYRPDLVPLIKAWLENVDDDCWQHFCCFRTGCRGEFVAKFAMTPDGGGPARIVEIMIDHEYTEVVTDSREWIFDLVAVVDNKMLKHAVNHL